MSGSWEKVQARLRNQPTELDEIKIYSPFLATRIRGPFLCRGCSIKFYTRRPVGEGEKFCSRECAFAFKVGPHHHMYRSELHQPKPLKHCLICGGIIGVGKYCVGECQKEAARRQNRAFNAAKKDLTPKKCKECARIFVAEYGNGRRSFCSQLCLEKMQRRARGSSNIARARKRGLPREYFNPTRILERDGWTCQLCGVKTPKRLRGTYDDRAPEIDHILPISQGGGHVWDNVQCACRKCNGAKRDKALGQQRLMFGAGHWRNKRKDIKHLGGGKFFSDLSA